MGPCTRKPEKPYGALASTSPSSGPNENRLLSAATRLAVPSSTSQISTGTSKSQPIGKSCSSKSSFSPRQIA